ncbi:phosphatase PAP2 family protein [Corynebacterium sp. UBA2622]|uniref:phosphatase PAP2 family protein n=1 Tax=Corynebacterium sp. UBA2622 TaxID=1946393 RepID=UPI0025C3016D|nr:phosphatase PAP2 family protein [Corynebacterium sp. UBA2622]
MNELLLTVWANDSRSPITDAIYYGFEPAWATLWVVLAGLVLASRRHDYRSFFTFGATVALTWVPVVVLKVIAHRPRPSAALPPHPAATPPGDRSFPSGHVAFATALAVAVFLFTRNR